MSLYLVLLYNLVILIASDVRAEEVLFEPQCSDLTRQDVERASSTKSPYRQTANLDDRPYVFPGCRPQRLWAVVRHGTRNPSKEVIEGARNQLMQLKKDILQGNSTKLCADELTRLRFWYFNMTADEEKLLVEEGEDELIDLAERMQSRFPELLPDQYDKSLYYFKYTATQRTLKSAQSFATGLFGRHHMREIIYPEPSHRDPILRVST